MTPAPWNELDRRAAQLLVLRRVLTQERARELHAAAAARGLARGGSHLLGGLVEAGVFRPEQADALLAALAAMSAPGASGEFVAPPAVPAPFGAHPSGTFPAPVAAFGAHPSGTFPAPVATFGAHPSGTFPAPPAPFGAHPSGTFAGGTAAARPPAARPAATGPAGAPGDTPAPTSPGTFGSGPAPTRPGHPATSPEVRGGPGEDDDERTIAFDAFDASSGGGKGSGGVARPGSGGGTRADGATHAPGVAAAAVLAAASPEDRYELLARLDGGDERWRARDRRIQREVELRLAPAETPEDAFLREARVTAQLDHPAIPKVHDLGRLRGRAFYTLDLAPGEPLDRLVARRRDRPELAALLRALLKAAFGVAQANDRGLVHADLAPEHVALGAFGEVALTGWGRARVLPGATQGVERAGAAAFDPGGARPNLAPELAKGHAPTVSADVWGLGHLLHVAAAGAPPRKGLPALRAGGRVPRALGAIIRTALAPRPEARYGQVHDLAEDLRRFLDGEALLADDTGLLAAAGRLARAHPLVATIAAGAFAAVALTAGVTWLQVRRGYREALARRGEAEEARVAAEASRKEADAALARAEADRALAHDRRGLLQLLGGQAQTRERFAAAVATLDRLAARPGAPAGAEASSAPAGADDAALLRVRLRLAEGRFALGRSASPSPEEALAAFLDAARALDRLGPGAGAGDAALRLELEHEAQLGVLLAARRCPGRRADAAAAAAIDALAREAGPYQAVGRILPRLAALEARAERLARARPPGVLPLEPELAGWIDDLLARRPDLALAHELAARYGLAVTGPGLHRGFKFPAPELDGKETSLERTRGGLYNRTFRNGFLAAYLDPLEPAPAIAYHRVLNDKYGHHAPATWVGGFALGQNLRASLRLRRHEGRLEAARWLLEIGRPAAAGDVVAALVERPEGLDLTPEVEAELVVLWARGRLLARRDVPRDLTQLTAPPQLAAAVGVLAGWDLLARGKTADGLQRIMQALQRGPIDHHVLADLTEALTDPRADGRQLLAQLARMVPAGARPPDAITAALVFARGVIGTRLGSPQAFLDLQAAGSSPWTLEHDINGRRRALFNLAIIRAQTRQEPRDPRPHVTALQLWSGLELLQRGEVADLADEAAQVVVSRLQALGEHGPALAFDQVGPVEQFLAVPIWIPREALRWAQEARR